MTVHPLALATIVLLATTKEWQPGKPMFIEIIASVVGAIQGSAAQRGDGSQTSVVVLRVPEQIVHA
jgi:hypothetical protein